MKNTENKDESATCTCCNTKIPLSSAHTPEGIDYAYNFCNADCFEKWKKSEKSGKSDKHNDEN